jgi:large subunit ribosomal protein L6
MSRIGRAPIALPAGVKVEIGSTDITVKGPKGQLSRVLPPDMSIRQADDGTLTVERPSDSQSHRALHGLTRALVNNMVLGVSDGFERVLDIEGTGYRAEDDGGNLVLNVGYSHPVRFEPPAGISFAVEDRGKRVLVRGIDNELVGQMAVNIRQVRPPEPYKGKGIRYAGEKIRRKAGKAGKVGR